MSKFQLNAVVRTITDHTEALIGEALKASNSAATADTKAKHKWKETAELAFSADGWRFADVNPQTKSETTKENRKRLNTTFIAQWPNVKEKANLLLSGKALKALSETAKARNRTIRMSFGPIMVLIEKYLKELEGIETIKVEETDGKKMHGLTETALKYAAGLEAPSAQLARLTDIIKTLKAAQGSIDLAA